MAGDLLADLKFMQRNASKLARMLGDVEINSELIAAIAAERLQERAQKIVMVHLRDAIKRSPEYSYQVLSRHLQTVFDTPEMIKFTTEGIQLRRQATKVAGNEGALMDGIEMARAALGVGLLSPEKALEFWRERIYRPAREGLIRPRRFKKNVGVGGQTAAFDYVGYATKKYSLTIRKRVQSWGALAPYWIWLDKGSSGYPPGNGTRFIDSATLEINRLFREEIGKVGTEYAEAITNEVRAFLQSPEGYEPGQFLGTVTVGEKNFRLSVTPTGELGIRRV
ncbi:hypothetical protein LCGC14_0748100 [marine sediment metagenome]|uniref:Uncharacterized protein n=1 Tax=marine sediment metagenome TaxID=412755 RepID=A0A0F9SPT7_9ZZZZ